MELLRIFAEIFKAPDPEKSDGDESMREETASQRLARYRSSEQSEVSDPDDWAVIHYGRATEEATDNESTDGAQEFWRIPKPTESIFQLAPHDAVIRTRRQNLVSGSCAKPVSPHSTPIEARTWTQTSPKGWMDSKVSKIPAEVGWKHLTHSAPAVLWCAFVSSLQ